MIKSSTFTAANYLAVLRGRSKKEFYAKPSIVVEESDETLFWLEILMEPDLIAKELLKPHKGEVEEILKILSKARKNTYS